MSNRKTPAPFAVKVVSSRGAPMGRFSSWHWYEEGQRLHLQRVPLDGGGYDPGGAYWGIQTRNNAVWCVWPENAKPGEQAFFTCKRFRDDARELVAYELGYADDDENKPRFFR